MMTNITQTMTNNTHAPIHLQARKKRNLQSFKIDFFC